MIPDVYKVPVRSGTLNKLLRIFPFMEVLSKIIYWKIKPLIPHKIGLYLKNLRTSAVKTAIISQVDLRDLSIFLKQIGIHENSTIVVHSSYDSLKSLKVLPRDIINMLVSLVGPNGNLAMPANRVYANTNQPIDFNVNNSKIWSGALPFTLLRDERSVKSHMPINSIVAIGPDAKNFVIDELTTEDETPCGQNSAWFKLYQNNALVLGLGVDLVHNLTMTHLVEDCWPDEWPSQNWYDRVTYRIMDSDYIRNVSILQRKEYIGKYFYTEARLARDLEKHGILKSYMFNGIKVQILSSVELIGFLKIRSKNFYPFYNCFLLKYL
jgi:aminoglycoside N3'-acetyltransferase